jgi:hypothetical protein
VQISNLKAEPNAAGGRIDLSWTNPAEPGFKGIKILRREDLFPTMQDIGSPVEIFNDPLSPAGQSRSFSDTGLKSETVYYYAVVARGEASNFFPAFVSSMATGSYETSAYLYDSLPAVYRSFDTATPPSVPGLDPADKQKGQLRRFVEMFGMQFDLFRSFAGGMRDLHDLRCVDGHLIALLAEWIGWQTDFTLDYAKQRNEVGYAPHYYRTTGIPANIRATINRLVTWDAQIKEFHHNVFLTNAPEQLVIYEMEKRGANWSPPKLVTLDLAYESRPSAVRSADGRDWLFYHARQSVEQTTTQGSGRALRDQWHLWFKEFDQGEWLPARPLSFDGDINKYPAVIQRRDGKWWMAWSSYKLIADQRVAEIRVRPFDTGRAAKPARLEGAKTGPFNFSDGDDFRINIKDGASTLGLTVILRREHFANIAASTPDEIASLLDRELPGVEVRATEDGRITFTTLTPGQGAGLTLPGSAVALKLGPFTSTAGSDAVGAQIVGNALSVGTTFPLANNDTLLINVDGAPAKAVTFTSARFADITKATAQEVADEINRSLPGVADVTGNLIRLTSATAGARSFISVDINASTAAAKLGFGAAPPGAGPVADDTEPAVFEDNANNLWLFWSSRRDGRWRIWYNRLTANGWGTAKPLTSGVEADHEPSVAFDRGGGGPGQGKIWVFWSRQKGDGVRNIIYRTTTEMDFAVIDDGDWNELELTPVPADHDRREPAPLLLGADNIELYFSANQVEGWQIWSTTLTPAPAAAPVQITKGQFTHRAAAVIGPLPNSTRLLFRSNESQIYVSPLYPASQTIDARYAGSTTADTRNPTKIGLHGHPFDVMRYTHDNGKRPPGQELKDHLYARDTVGIYLTPDTDDEQLILRKRTALASIVRSFLPIQVRPVFLIQQAHLEAVYNYDLSATGTPVLIKEEMVDTILGEVFTGPSDSFRDLVNFRFVRTWDAGHTNVSIPDLSVLPPDLSFRLFMSGVEEGA